MSNGSLIDRFERLERMSETWGGRLSAFESAINATLEQIEILRGQVERVEERVANHGKND